MKSGMPRHGYARVNEKIGRHLSGLELIERLQEPDAEVALTAFDGESFERLDPDATSFSEVVFHNCSFEDVDFSGCTFTDILFVGCRFISCSMERSWLNRVDFRACSAPGLGFNQGRLTGVSFTDCQLRYADFSEASVRGVVARDTCLAESVWRAVKLGRVELERCDLSRADVMRTSLEGVDLSSCNIGGLVVSSGLRELRGAIIAPEQALDLVGFLGVRIKDE